MRIIDADKLIEYINNIPTIEPERKRGKWNPKDSRQKQEIFICSECGKWAYSPWIGERKNPKPNRCKYNYCPNCGADMREEEPNAETAQAIEDTNNGIDTEHFDNVDEFLVWLEKMSE